MPRFWLPLLLVAFVWPVSPADARTWTSRNGEYELEADLIAANETTAILKKTKSELVAVELEELSEQDRRYVNSKEATDQLRQSAEQMQTWTSRNGAKVRARVVAYGRRDLTVKRQRGKLMVNDQPLEELSPLQQLVFFRVLSELEKTSIENRQDAENWARRLGGETKTYPLEGVLLELESGDRVAAPFFMFSEEDLQVLQPGWTQWLAAEEDRQAREREDLYMQTEAMRYQQSRVAEQQYRAEQQRIELLKLNMLAAQTGLTSIWEVGLRPRPGVYGRPTTVMVTARNSQLATAMALQQYPNYQVYGVRRASR